MMDDNDFDMTCPYDMSHTVKKSRMQFHLLKCRLNKAKQEQANSNRERSSMKRCPYNAAHDVEAYNFDKHCELCPDRGLVLNWATTHASAQALVKVPCSTMVLPKGEENWDDSEHPPYDPTTKNLGKPIYRHLVGESKSARKTFRSEERTRFRQMDSNAAAGGDDAEVPAEAASEARPLGREPKSAFDYTVPLRKPWAVSNTFKEPLRFEPSVHGMGRGRPVNGGQAGAPPAGRGAGCNGAIKKVPNGTVPKPKKNKRKAKNGDDKPPAYVGLPPPPAAAAMNGDVAVDGAVRLMAGLGVGPGGAAPEQSYGDWISATAAGGAGGNAHRDEWTSLAELPREGPEYTHPEANLVQSDPGRGRGRLQQQLKEKRDQYDRL